MNFLILIIGIFFSISTFAFSEKCSTEASEECKKEASLYVDKEIVADICQNVKPGFNDCAEITKTDIYGAQIMTDSDLSNCAKAFSGFKDCYDIASNGLDKKYSVKLCLNAKDGFKSCAEEKMKTVGFPVLTNNQIEGCLNIP